MFHPYGYQQIILLGDISTKVRPIYTPLAQLHSTAVKPKWKEAHVEVQDECSLRPNQAQFGMQLDSIFYWP